MPMRIHLCGALVHGNSALVQLPCHHIICLQEAYRGTQRIQFQQTDEHTAARNVPADSPVWDAGSWKLDPRAVALPRCHCALMFKRRQCAARMRSHELRPQHIHCVQQCEVRMGSGVHFLALVVTYICVVMLAHKHCDNLTFTLLLKQTESDWFSDVLMCLAMHRTLP